MGREREKERKGVWVKTAYMTFVLFALSFTFQAWSKNIYYDLANVCYCYCGGGCFGDVGIVTVVDGSNINFTSCISFMFECFT